MPATGATPLTPATAQRLYDALSRTVVRLETRREFDEQTFVSVPVGTGFLVDRSNRGRVVFPARAGVTRSTG